MYLVLIDACFVFARLTLQAFLFQKGEMRTTRNIYSPTLRIVEVRRLLDYEQFQTILIKLWFILFYLNFAHGKSSAEYTSLFPFSFAW